MDLLTATQGAVRVLTLNRPEVRNALDSKLQAQLLQALAEAEQDKRVRAVVLAGAGEAFCAGLDLSELKAMSGKSTEANRRDSQGYADLLTRLYTLSKPTVAAVNGHAVAGGAGLVAACDVAVMSEEAKLGYTEARIGFVPAIVAVLLVQQLPEKRLRDLLLSARLIPAVEAERWGLINEVLPQDEVLPRAIALAENLARNSSSSLELTKALLAALPGMGVSEGLRYAADLNALARSTDDLKEGITAFLEKRPPEWQT